MTSDRRLLLRRIGLLVGIGGLATALASRWAQVAEAGLPSMWRMGLSLLSAVLSVHLMGLAWVVLLPGNSSTGAAFWGFVRSQMGKYLPGGGVLQAGAQVVTARGERGSAGAVVASYGWYLIVTLAGAVSVAAPAGYFAGARFWPAAAALGVAIWLAVLLPTWFPRLVTVLGRWVPSRFAQAAAWVPPRGRLVGAVFVTGAAFLAFGFSLGILLEGAAFSSPVWAMTLAWVAGFVALPFPAGLGVRESVLLALLAVDLGYGAVLGAAVVHRLITVSADAVGVLISLAVPRTQTSGQVHTRRPHADSDPALRGEKASNLLAVLGRHVELVGARLLDVGCGSGHMTALYARAVGERGSVDAVDVEDIRVVDEGFRFHRMDGPDLPFGERRFDIVISNQVVEHVGGLSAQEHHLAEMARVLRPDGVVYVATPARWRLVEPHFRLPLLSWLPSGMADAYVRATGRGEFYDARLPTRRALRSMAAAVGLDPTDVTADMARVKLDRRRAWLIPRWMFPDRVLAILTPFYSVIVLICRPRPLADDTA